MPKRSIKHIYKTKKQNSRKHTKQNSRKHAVKKHHSRNYAIKKQNYTNYDDMNYKRKYDGFDEDTNISLLQNQLDNIKKAKITVPTISRTKTDGGQSYCAIS